MDRVQVVKWESSALGGTQNNTQPTPINPQEDALEAMGLYLQDGSNRDTNILIARSGNDMTFKDVTNATPKTLTNILNPSATTSPSFKFNVKVTDYTLYIQTTNVTATYVTTDGAAPGTGNQIPLNASTGVTFSALMTAARPSTGTVSNWAMRGSAKRVAAGTCTVDTGGIQEVLATGIVGSLATDVDIDNTNKLLRVKVTGLASATINWVCSIRVVEASL